MKQQEISKGNKIVIWVAVILSISVIVFAFMNNNKNSSNNEPGFYDKFAQCLTDKGAVMYGAKWCSHCQEQKAVFGKSFQYINYVECPDNIQVCIDKGVQGYPTWIISTSTRFEGFDKNSTMKELASSTGCELPQINL